MGGNEKSICNARAQNEPICSFNKFGIIVPNLYRIWFFSTKKSWFWLFPRYRAGLEMLLYSKVRYTYTPFNRTCKIRVESSRSDDGLTSRARSCAKDLVLLFYVRFHATTSPLTPIALQEVRNCALPDQQAGCSQIECNFVEYSCFVSPFLACKVWSVALLPFLVSFANNVHDTMVLGRPMASVAGWKV